MTTAVAAWAQDHEYYAMKYAQAMMLGWLSWTDGRNARIAAEWFENASVHALTASDDVKVRRSNLWRRRSGEASVMAFMFKAISKRPNNARR